MSEEDAMKIKKINNDHYVVTIKGIIHILSRVKSRKCEKWVVVSDDQNVVFQFDKISEVLDYLHKVKKF